MPMNDIYPDGPITNGDKKLMEMEPKTDLDKLIEEKNAAAHLRDSVNWVVGFLGAAEGATGRVTLDIVRKKLEESPERHTNERCNDIF